MLFRSERLEVVESRSISKSAVSRRFLALSQKQMTAWLSKPLHELDIRVIVIDDSAYSRQTITRMLETSPLVDVVGVARDGEDALRKVIELQPDLVTLDLEMPRMDGFTFLRLIMAKRPTPVMVISGRAGEEDVFKALELGAVD